MPKSSAVDEQKLSYKALNSLPNKPNPLNPKAGSRPKPQTNTAKNISQGCERYRSLVAKYRWDNRIAMAVMEAESTTFIGGKKQSCNPKAANRNDVHRNADGSVLCVGSFGLFQISCHSGQIYDEAKNVAIAWEKYKARGWQPWGAYTSGAYLKYL